MIYNILIYNNTLMHYNSRNILQIPENIMYGIKIIK